jgi:hypothetical protein
MPIWSLLELRECVCRHVEDKDYLLGHTDALIGAFADIVIHLDIVEDFMVNFIAEVSLPHLICVFCRNISYFFRKGFDHVSFELVHANKVCNKWLRCRYKVV